MGRISGINLISFPSGALSSSHLLGMLQKIFLLHPAPFWISCIRYKQLYFLEN